jgi:hypothetical protein
VAAVRTQRGQVETGASGWVRSGRGCE